MPHPENRVVSILTRPSGRAQRRPNRATCGCSISFNPHPAKRSGATTYYVSKTVDNGYGGTFQSSPGQAVGRNHHQERAVRLGEEVSILTRPSGRAQLEVAVQRDPRQVVSILTRPSGRAQRWRGARRGVHRDVSILTRPSGRAQHLLDHCPYLPNVRFNPHPAKRSGATSEGDHATVTYVEFQSSPGQAVGRNRVSLFATHPAYCFNPHPAKRSGATSRFRGPCDRARRFQSSPGQAVGRNERARLIQLAASLVSILTRPSGRAQHRLTGQSGYEPMFQSSPGQAVGRNV